MGYAHIGSNELRPKARPGERHRPRPTLEQLAPIKAAAVEAYRTDPTVEDFADFRGEHPHLSRTEARQAQGVHRAVETAAPALTALGLEHAAEFLRIRDFANMHPDAVLFAEGVAEKFTARAAALADGEYENEEQPA